MKTVPEDPPSSLEEAELLFGRFLSSQGYPAAVHWVHETELQVDCYSRLSVRRNPNWQRAEFEYCYQKARAKGLGVELAARGASPDHTFAVIFVPEDDVDRQHRLMSRGLKLSCPTSLVTGSFM